LALASSIFAVSCAAGGSTSAIGAAINCLARAILALQPALAASGSKQHGVPMRDLVPDWKKWSRAERVLAVMGTLLMVALPFGLLMTG
jgi:hypothetical protein